MMDGFDDPFLGLMQEMKAIKAKDEEFIRSIETGIPNPEP